MTTNLLNQARLLLTKLHNGDYAHAGGAEAVEIVLNKVLGFNHPTLMENKALDVGCGFGGTANYFHKQGMKQIHGIDIDAATIAYAKHHYPEICFNVMDALKIHMAFSNQKFGFIYLFNVAYAIADKENLIKSITKVAQKNCILTLFDYALRTDNTHSLRDLSDKLIHPINVSSITQTLLANKWKVIAVDDTTQKYINWYKALLESLYTKHGALLKEYSQETILKVQHVFESLLNMMTKNFLNSTIIYAILLS